MIPNPISLNTRYRRIAFLILLIIVGYLLRLHLMWGEDYNWDEWLHINIASGASIAKVLEYSRYETHPPLGHLIRHFWMMMGEGTLYQRHLATVFGLSCIPVIYLLGKEIAGRTTGMISAIIFTFAHHAILLSAVVRNYSMASFFALLAMLFLFHYLRKYKLRYLLLFGTFAAFSCLTLYLSALLFFTLTVSIMGALALSKNYRQAVSIGAISLIAVLPTLICYFDQYPYFAPYVERSHILSDAFAEHIGLIQQTLSRLLFSFLIIPNALMSPEGSYPERSFWIQSLAITAMLICIIIPLHQRFGIGRLRSSVHYFSAHILLISSLLLIPLITSLMMLHGDMWLTSSRRLSLLSLPFIVLYAITFAGIQWRLRWILLLIPLLSGLLVNISHQEFIFKTHSIEQIKKLSIKNALQSNNFIAIASSNTAFTLAQPQENFYEIFKKWNIGKSVHHLRAEAFMPYQSSRVYFGVFTVTTINDRLQQQKNLRNLLLQQKNERPWVVMAMSQWDINFAEVIASIYNCEQVMQQGRILLDAQDDSGNSQIVMFALPYESLSHYVEQDFKCHK